MQRIQSNILLPMLALLITACQAPRGYNIVFPEQIHHNVQWTPEEQLENIAARTLARTQYSSVHLVRLMGKEKPHYHDRHDLYVSLLSGSSKIHFKDTTVEMFAGDVVFIPSGTYHWAENTGESASIISTHFTPAFDGKDKRFH